MSQQFIIQLADDIAQHALEIANMTGLNVDKVLVEKISAQSLMPSHDIDTNLALLSSYSDSKLWWLVALGFPSDSRKRLSELTVKLKETDLKDNEAQEHTHLLESYDWYHLLRSESLVILQERGYNIQSYLKRHKPDK